VTFLLGRPSLHKVNGGCFSIHQQEAAPFEIFHCHHAESIEIGLGTSAIAPAIKPAKGPSTINVPAIRARIGQSPSTFGGSVLPYPGPSSYSRWPGVIRNHGLTIGRFIALSGRLPCESSKGLPRSTQLRQLSRWRLPARNCERPPMRASSQAVPESKL
jgi:hypothetical protein